MSVSFIWSRVQKKSLLHFCEPEEGFVYLVIFEEGLAILQRLFSFERRVQVALYSNEERQA